jgi:hypothetical protein
MGIMVFLCRRGYGLPYRSLGLWLLLSLSCLTGCGVMTVAPTTKAAAKDPTFTSCVAKFYLPYAVLAAAAYGADTQADFSRALRNGTGKNKSDTDYAEINAEITTSYLAMKEEVLMPGTRPLPKDKRDAVFENCLAAWHKRNDALLARTKCSSGADDCNGNRQREEDAALPSLPLACGAAFQSDRNPPAASKGDTSPYVDQYPDNDSYCDPKKASQTYVPVTDVAKSERWKRRPDIEKYANIHQWRVFVPGLAVEVWSRERHEKYAQKHDGPPREYAIVFRGTYEGGGWFSNFRLITGLVPLFWDQYQQAEWSTQQIVEQIRLIELEKWQPLSGQGIEEFDNYFPYITAVGHSLGAGLAKYAYFRVKEISKVVGFNASPVDGARTFIRVEERLHVMSGRRQPEPVEACSETSNASAESEEKKGQLTRSVVGAFNDRDERPSSLEKNESGGRNAIAIYSLYERGEILNSIAPCKDGPEWGSEGGPINKCQVVDLARESYTLKNMFKQHRMNMLACELAVALRKVPEPAVTQAGIQGRQ